MSAAEPTAPQLELLGEGRVALCGHWSHRDLTRSIATLRRALARLPRDTHWDLTSIGRMDSFGALVIWRAWGRTWPPHVALSPVVREALDRVAAARGESLPPQPRPRMTAALVLVGEGAFRLGRHATDFVALLGRIALDVMALAGQPGHWPLREITANLYKVGVQAMPVAALVGFLIGVVLSYLSALQLQTFGADVFIVNILGLGIIRELGPVLVSVLVAGRSGSAMTAQIGVMRVTEEIDALRVMGVSPYVRLVLPKVVALTLAMPMLVLWTSAVALLGGMVTADLQLNLGYGFFIQTLPRVVPPSNLLLALVKGLIFGLLIALVACHFGLRVKPNTESLAAKTTASVVSAITLVILVDAVLAIVTRRVGVPY
ncbi:MAG: ABC transporter permease [Zoogloeaceae bacterium]|nr:ABC transporter permease [Zoogloeaceae bacterium]